MSWTDERIEELRKLWADGLSASQIANTLGGVSRNAVIGKIHRLGLSGRVKAARAPARRTTTVAAAAAATAARAKPASPPRVMAVGSTVVKVVEREAYEVAPEPVVTAAVLALHEGVTLLDLKQSSCRWPVGDPSSEGFRYCGARTGQSETYCAAHAEVAFPSRTRNKTRKDD